MFVMKSVETGLIITTTSVMTETTTLVMVALNSVMWRLDGTAQEEIIQLLISAWNSVVMVRISELMNVMMRI